MKRRVFSLILMTILWLIPQYGKAVTLQVPNDYQTLQSAIGNAPDGSTIIVAPGSYSEALSFPNLNKTLYVKSSGGAASTIIHGGGIRNLLYIANASYGGKDLTFDGFTFTQGRDVTNISPVTIINASPVFLNCQFKNNSSVSQGGAVLVYAASNPTFINCQFSSNQSGRFGGAVLVNGPPAAQASFKQCLFENNTANGSNISQGGALTFLSAGGTVLSCIFRGNSANYVGGAVRIIDQIYSNPSNRVIISDCQFTDNFCLPGSSPPPTPTEGGAIHVEANVTVDIRKCYFSNNYAMSGGAVHNYRAQLSISDSVFDNNRAVGTNGSGYGGAIAVNSYSPSPTNTLDATLTVKNSMIRNCLAPVGGGIFFQGDWGQNLTNSRRGQITLTNVVIDKCVATKANNSYGSGGALGLAFANLTGSGIYLLNNTADSGGAICAYQNTLVTLTNYSYIIGNNARIGASITVDSSTSPPPLLTNTIKAYNQGDATANLAILMAVPTIPINGEAWLAYIIAPYAGSPSISPDIGVLAPNTGGYAAGTVSDPITLNTTYQLTSPNHPTQQVGVTISSNSGLGINDFNGDKKSDILWQHAGSGQVYIWLMDGTSISSQSSPSTLSDLSWQVKGVGDFNGDGKADILWQNSISGQVYIWLMNGTSISSQASPVTVSDLNWQIIGVCDFNGDGKADILWRHVLTGQVYIWLMNGTSISSQASPVTVSDLNWQIIGVCDFNGDGKADILWRHVLTGQVYIWLMNGTSVSSQASPGTVSDLGWGMEGVGDFNGDGKADILWRHASSGQLYIWLMNGTIVLFSDSPGFVTDPNWVIKSIGDFDGDGKADILLQHAGSGQVNIWQMDGTTKIFSGPVGTISDLNWKIK